MFDILTFLLSDYRCPHCGHSLRFRWVRSINIPLTPWKDGMTTTSCEICPICEGHIKAEWHPAILDDWLWSKRLAPGLLIWIVAMILDFHPILMAAGTLALLIGFVLILHYMIAERWGRAYYGEFEPPTGPPEDR